MRPVQVILGPGGRMVMIGGTGSQRRRAYVNENNVLTLRSPDPTGLSCTSFTSGDEWVLTPRGAKLIRRRRAKNKVARASRKANR